MEIISQLILRIFFSIFVLAIPGFGYAEEKIENRKIFKFGKGMKEALNHSCLKNGEYGVKFYSLDRREVLFQHRAKDLFIPASNAKFPTFEVIPAFSPFSLYVEFGFSHSKV